MSTSSLATYILEDILGPIGSITSRKMMGGVCVYHRAKPCFIILGDALYVKATNAPFIEKLESMGAEKFTYERRDGSIRSMGYWKLPDEILDAPTRCAALCEEVIAHLS